MQRFPIVNVIIGFQLVWGILLLAMGILEQLAQPSARHARSANYSRNCDHAGNVVLTERPSTLSWILPYLIYQLITGLIGYG